MVQSSFAASAVKAREAGGCIDAAPDSFAESSGCLRRRAVRNMLGCPCADDYPHVLLINRGCRSARRRLAGRSQATGRPPMRRPSRRCSMSIPSSSKTAPIASPMTDHWSPWHALGPGGRPEKHCVRIRLQRRPCRGMSSRPYAADLGCSCMAHPAAARFPLKPYFRPDPSAASSGGKRPQKTAGAGRCIRRRPAETRATARVKWTDTRGLASARAEAV